MTYAVVELATVEECFCFGALSFYVKSIVDGGSNIWQASASVVVAHMARKVRVA